MAHGRALSLVPLTSSLRAGQEGEGAPPEQDGGAPAPAAPPARPALLPASLGADFQRLCLLSRSRAERPGAGGGGPAGPPAVRWLPRAKMAASSARSSACRRVAAGLARRSPLLPLPCMGLIVITAVTSQGSVLLQKDFLSAALSCSPICLCLSRWPTSISLSGSPVLLSLGWVCACARRSVPTWPRLKG